MLGTTAIHSLMGKALTLSSLRGRDLDLDGATGRATIHPSFLLRMPDRGRAAAEDLRRSYRI